MAITAVKKKPHLVWGAVPVEGHTAPQLLFVEEMIKRGYEVTFVGGAPFQKKAEDLGAKYHSLPQRLTPEIMAGRELIPVGLPRLSWDIENLFIPVLSDGFEGFTKVLEDIRKEDPTREVIIMQEQFLMGALAWRFGAPAPAGYDKVPRIINLNVVPLTIESEDTGPFGTALPPDSTKSGKMRNRLLNQFMSGPMGVLAPANKLLSDALKKNGATDVPADISFLSAPAASYEATLHLSSPSLDYPRSDLPPSIKFVGCPPKRPLNGVQYPEWWSEITDRGSKKVVAVAQGTIAMEYKNLIIPTIEGLAGREDVIVVALLGARGAKLPDEVKIPDNAKVLDYFPYDALLPHTDVWVMNAGFGGFQHGVVNGVPMVLAGDTEDKPEVAARGEWAGIAVDLKTGSPEKAKFVEGIDEVLSNDKYKKRVMEIKAEVEAIDTVGLVEKQIIEFTA